uniref:Uncharacterized protein n=1 Tax=Panagrolaimus sp. PS1159 TaxID=55785 RepID=A0AC35FXF6_9BILA
MSKCFCGESFLLDQSCLSEASALGNSTTFLGEISESNVVEFKEKEITEEISLKLPVTSSAANTYIYPESETIVCEPLVTKAASKRKTFVEASFKAPRQKERTKFTVQIKKKSKVKAKFVIKTKTVDFKFKQPSEKEQAKKIILIPKKAKINLSVSEPSLKNVEADIALFAECISEESANKLPQDIMRQVEKVSCNINLCKVPVPIHEMDKLLQFEEVSTNESDTVKNKDDLIVQKEYIGSDLSELVKTGDEKSNLEPTVREKLEELKLPLSFKELMEMSPKAPPVPVLTEFSSLDDLMNQRQTFQTEQIMRQKNSPHYAFQIGENIIINCGRVGSNENYSQAIISDKNCNVYDYDYHNCEWKCRMKLSSKNILSFDRPFGTGRSQIGGIGMPSNSENDFEIVVFDGHVFDEVALECYNVAFDTINPPAKLLPEQMDENNILFIKKQPQNHSDSPVA